MFKPDSRDLVDAELLPLLESFPTAEFTEEMLPLVRSMPLRFTVDPADLERTDLAARLVPGPAGAPEVAVLIYRPRAAAGALPCIFHIHGGGYVVGSAAGQEAMHRPLAAELNCMIISVNYRLAPETRAPGAVEDCYAALAWTFAEADALGVDAARIGVMGESAGGGLAAALALLARDRGEYNFRFQHLIYPMLDDRTCVAADPHPHAGEYIWTPHNNHFGWSCLLGQEPGSDGISPYAAPARAESLAGLPRTFISTGSLDLFLEEDLEYARRLMRAAVPVEFHVYPGGFHAFDLAPDAEISKSARRDSRAALARALRG